MSALHLQLSASPSLVIKKAPHIWSGEQCAAPAGLFSRVCLKVTHLHLIQITEGISYWWGHMEKTHRAQSSLAEGLSPIVLL